jgi:NAD(P)-dependent dehydrogenase (short-subunit alcohol dehydrogenase family)
MAMAQRFAKEGHDVALVSRSADRHAGYRAELAGSGVEVTTFVGDVRENLGGTLDAIYDRFGRIDVVYYGPAAIEPAGLPADITETTPAAVEFAMRWLYPAVEAVNRTLPGMRERGSGGFLLAGGLSSVRRMPALGALALSSAALRNYALTLHEGLAGTGVYAGTLTIGGLIERGDIHRMVTAQEEKYGAAGGHTLNPDDLADGAWKLYTERERAEAVFDTLG